MPVYITTGEVTVKRETLLSTFALLVEADVFLKGDPDATLDGLPDIDTAHARVCDAMERVHALAAVGGGE